MSPMRVHIASCVVVLLAGCSALRESSPPVLVHSAQIGLAVREYVEATRALADDAGLLAYYPESAALNTGRKHLLSRRGQSASELYNVQIAATEPAPLHRARSDVNHFIRTGGAAAAMLCQAYLARLSDRADLLAYLKDEYGYVNDLTNTAFAIFTASATASHVLGAVDTFVNSSIDRCTHAGLKALIDKSVQNTTINVGLGGVVSVTAPKQ